MTPHVHVLIDDEGKPANIPDSTTIINQSYELGLTQATSVNISGVHIVLDKRSDGDISDIWVKSGHHVTMGEARTQQYIAQYLQANNNHDVRAPRVYLAFTWGGLGYIVSEYIEGRMCDKSDTASVAAAVQTLIAIPSPSSRPGPVGGGTIEHPLFVERTSDIRYESVEELEDHVNGIISVMGKRERVSLRKEVAEHGLRLCVSDLKLVNFMNDNDGRIVAVDYGGYSFLPPSFFAFALRCDSFAHELGYMLDHPPCKDNTTALVSASCVLVQFNKNNIGVPRRLRSRPRE